MKVKNWIKKKPIVIARTALVQEAMQIMKENSIRHLPVVEGDGDLVGFITESDLKQFSFPSMVEEIPVHQVMVTNPLTIGYNDSIEKAAKLFNDNKIAGLPVMKDDKLVGVITSTDLLTAFIEVVGMLKNTTRIDVLINEEIGNIDAVTKIIENNGCEIVNVAMDTGVSKKKVCYFRLEHCDSAPVVKALEEAGHKVLSVME